MEGFGNYSFKSQLVGADQNIGADTIGYIQDNNDFRS